MNTNNNSSSKKIKKSQISAHSDYKSGIDGERFLVPHTAINLAGWKRKVS